MWGFVSLEYNNIIIKLPASLFLYFFGTKYSLKFSFSLCYSFAFLQFRVWVSVQTFCGCVCSLIRRGSFSRVQREQLAAIFQLLRDNKETFGDVSEGDMEEQLRLYSIWGSSPTHLSHSETWWTKALRRTLKPGSQWPYTPLGSWLSSSSDTVMLFTFVCPLLLFAVALCFTSRPNQRIRDETK